MNLILRISDVHFAYDGHEALRGLDFSVPAAGLFAIIGPNGSGKTTLLRLMARLLHPARGSIRLHDRDLRAIPRRELARKLAFVPQEGPGDVPFSVRQSVLMARAPHQGLLGLENRRDLLAMERALRITGVEQLSDRLLDQLSGGERQRVCIARALCQEAEIMLLDEPTKALDYAHQMQIMDLLASLCRDRGVTVVMVSHDLNLAALYADHVLALAGGQAAARGNPTEVLRRDVLERIYGCRFAVDTVSDPRHPRITPLPGFVAG